MSELTAVATLTSWLVSRAEILPSLAEEYASKFAAANIGTVDELQAKGTQLNKLMLLLSSKYHQSQRTTTSCSLWASFHTTRRRSSRP